MSINQIRETFIWRQAGRA